MANGARVGSSGACECQSVLAFWQVSRSTWDCRTAQRYMVRRRSTVRFRKGAPRYERFSNVKPSTSFGRVAFEWQTPSRTGACDQAICGGIAPRKATPIKGTGSGLARYAAHTGTTYRIASTTARRQFRFGTAARWSLAGRGRPQRRDQCPLGNGGIRGVAGGRNPGGDEPVRKIGGDRGRASERCRAPRSLE